MPKHIIFKNELTVKPEELKYEGQWFYRRIGGWRWIPTPTFPRIEMMLRYKRGIYFVYRDKFYEYSYRHINTTSTSVAIGDTHMNNEVEYTLFDDLSILKERTRDEALAIAKFYERKEQYQHIVYNDPIHGRGMYTVNAMGIIHRTATGFEV